MTQEQPAAPGGPPEGPLANVVIWETLIAAFAITFRDPGLLLRAAAGGLLLLAATTLVSVALPPNPFTLLLMLLAPIAAYSHFGVNWYRAVLLGPQGLIRPALRWDRRHWRFFGLGLLLGGGLLALGGVLSMSLPLPPALIALCLLYPAARSSFLFPAIAVEEPYSLAYAWRHTKGQGGRLTVLLLLAGLPLFLIVAIAVSLLFDALIGISLFDVASLQAGAPGAPEARLGEITGEGGDLAISPLKTLSLKMITEALTMGVLAVLYSIVALAFRRCTGWVPAAPAGPPADRGAP
ncbi:hypothetical protein [Pelagibius marinus]|uniref:hypothetical protein n=1 Tax=Pelagibius marinus TaxID=2762760 RepID=UPI001872D1A7|nr:hypothetical protein [Pelagibius marinus]